MPLLMRLNHGEVKAPYQDWNEFVYLEQTDILPNAGARPRSELSQGIRPQIEKTEVI